MSTAASERSVFLNVPFDSDYEECFLALIAGLTGLGLKPRSVLEVTPGKDRLQRIYRLLRSCRYSLHDLSRVELSAGHPRFNMPFEAGLATALALDRRGHDRFVLESQPHRLQRTCSDLNGTDPEIHLGTAEGVLACVLNLFRRVQPIDPDDLNLILQSVRAAADLVKNRKGSGGIYTRACFLNLVSTAEATEFTIRALRAGRRAARSARRQRSASKP